MFRNAQLLRRFQDIPRIGHAEAARPVAVLADEDPVESSILRSVLEKYNFSVVEATDGATAFDSILKFSAQLVIAALQLPAMDGYQLCQKVRQLSITENIPFILITPKGEFPDRLMGHETFASDYVQRPVNLNEFEQRLNAVLSVRSPQQGQWEERKDFSKNGENLLLEVRDLLESPTVPASLNAGESLNEIFAEFNIKQRSANDSGVETNTRVEMLRHQNGDQQKISEKTTMVYREVTDFLLASFRRAEGDELVDVLSGCEIVRQIVELLKNENGLLLLATDRASEFSLSQHSVNVAIIGSSIAQNRRMPEDRIIRTCLAGMLHDIGTVKLPKRLIYKTGVLSASERAEIRRRPIYSAQILSASQGFDWLPQIVSQVYEREDGTGYPYGLDAKQISHEAKVLGISDALEACIHRRPYRKAASA